MLSFRTFLSLSLCGDIHISSCCIILSVCAVSLSLFSIAVMLWRNVLGGVPFLLRDPLENSRSPFQLKPFPCHRQFLSSFSSSKRPPSLFPTILLHVWYTRICVFFFFILLVVVFFISFVFSKKESFHRTFFLISTLFWTRTLKSVSPPNSIISICELCA